VEILGGRMLPQRDLLAEVTEGNGKWTCSPSGRPASCPGPR